MARSKKGLARLIDGYAEGLIEKEEFAPRAERMRRRVAALEEQLERQRVDENARAEFRLLVGWLEEFADKVKAGLEGADYAARREILRALVKRVEVDRGSVNVVFKITPPPDSSRPGSDPNEEDSQHRGQRVGDPLRERGPGDAGGFFGNGMGWLGVQGHVLLRKVGYWSPLREYAAPLMNLPTAPMVPCPPPKLEGCASYRYWYRLGTSRRRVASGTETEPLHRLQVRPSGEQDQDADDDGSGPYVEWDAGKEPLGEKTGEEGGGRSAHEPDEAVGG